MNTTRTYTMRARAAAVEETRRRVMQAAFALAEDRMFSDISLDAVARRAGVSVQTVLRQFGSRAELLESTKEYAAGVVAEERRSAPGDVDGALRLLVDHYERRGDATLLRLAEESRDPLVASVVERGRDLHRSWVVDTFGPLLADVPESSRDEHLDLLVVATDVYAWKILRRDRRLSRAVTEARMHALVAALLAALPSGKDS
jgi:AcrR family transcriptional regulator